MNQREAGILLQQLLKEKLRDVRHEEIPEINNPKIRFPVLERQETSAKKVPRNDKEVSNLPVKDWISDFLERSAVNKY